MSAGSSGEPAHEVRPADVLTAALAEFNVLRKEISDRSSAQTTVLNLNLTASAAIASLVLAQKVDPLVLLVLPLVSACFGMLFFDHAANIDQIGRYLREEIQPLIVSTTGNGQLFQYENRVHEHELTFLPRGLSMGVPLLLMFSAFPIAALIRAWSPAHHGWALGLWLLGVVVQLLFLAHWAAFIRRPFVKGRR